MLVAKLFLIGEGLPRSAGAGLPAVIAAWRQAVSRCPDDLPRGGLGIAALGFGDLGADTVARKRTGDEHDVAVAAGDALAAVRQRLDIERQFVAAPRPLLRGGLFAHPRPIVAAALGWDLDEYRREAELFLEEIDREYYLQGAGHKLDLEIEPIYERHEALFEREAVEGIGEARRAAQDEDGARLRYLHQFALDGHLGAATRALEARLAALEASLEVEVDGEAIPYRMAPAAQSNEPDGERRAEIEAARNAVLAERLNPLHLEALESTHAACTELGWPSYLDAYSDVRALDLGALSRELDRFAEAVEPSYPVILEPELERTVGLSLAELRRSDLTRFFRAPHLDGLFPGERMVPALRETLAGLGIDQAAQSNVMLDTEARPTKSPRAFCSTPRVPAEVYLVMPPIGGREDYAALFHEAGHAEHYGCTDADLVFEFRHLGDNAVTESFAFLLEGLTANPAWLQDVLGAEAAEPAVGHARALPGSYSCAATRRRSPTRSSCTGRTPTWTRCRSAMRACSGAGLAFPGRWRPGYRMSIPASTSPATYAPGPSRWIGGGSWRSASGPTGSRAMRPASGSEACG